MWRSIVMTTAMCSLFLVLACEDGTRRIYPKDDTAGTGDGDIVQFDGDDLLADGDGLLAGDDNEVVADEPISDDGTSQFDGDTGSPEGDMMQLDDNTIHPDGDTMVADDAPIVPDADEPSCVTNETRQIPCGLNGNGLQSQICIGGEWQNQGDCVDDDVCVNNATQEVSCGLNGRGSQTQICVDGQWQNDGDCTDPDVCIDNEERVVPCGINDSGTQDQRCVLGQWENISGCRVPGRWDCVSQTCTPVYGDSGCGNGTCSPNNGESPQSCPADCGALAEQDGQGKPCSDDIDCAFYLWPKSGRGYWECRAVSGQDYCNAIETSNYCGTNGFDYCYYGTVGIETPGSCPEDCANKPLGQGNTGMQCDNDRDCIFLDWPEQ